MKVKLNKVRLAFPQLFNPTALDANSVPKYSATFILPPNHKGLQEIEKAISAVAAEKWGARAKDVVAALKAADKTCLHDGATKAAYAGFAGNKFVRASSKIKPLTIDQNRNEVAESSGLLYPGCYVNAIIEIWAQDNATGRRVNAALMGVQFAGDGERLGGGGAARAEDFDILSDEPAF